MPYNIFAIVKDILLVSVQCFTLLKFVESTKDKVNEPYRIMQDNIAKNAGEISKIKQRLESGTEHFTKLDMNGEVVTRTLLTIEDALISIVTDEMVKKRLEKQKEVLHDHVAQQTLK